MTSLTSENDAFRDKIRKTFWTWIAVIKKWSLRSKYKFKNIDSDIDLVLDISLLLVIL